MLHSPYLNSFVFQLLTALPLVRAGGVLLQVLRPILRVLQQQCNTCCCEQLTKSRLQSGCASERAHSCHADTPCLYTSSRHTRPHSCIHNIV